MRIDIKKEIAGACTPPEPKGRDTFLAAVCYPKLTYPEFVLSQIGYIRKRIWLISAVVLLSGTGVCVIPETDERLVWLVSALIPMLAVQTAAEISRSDLFGMSEMEAACRFDLTNLASARMLILGVCNFVVIFAAAAFLGFFSSLGIAKSILYILTPYVLAAGISLAILRKAKGSDGVYLSTAAALAIGLFGAEILGRNHYHHFEQRTLNSLMLIVCAGGAVFMVVQIKNLLMRKDYCYGTQT